MAKITQYVVVNGIKLTRRTNRSYEFAVVYERTGDRGGLHASWCGSYQLALKQKAAHDRLNIGPAIVVQDGCTVNFNFGTRHAEYAAEVAKKWAEYRATEYRATEQAKPSSLVCDIINREADARESLI